MEAGRWRYFGGQREDSALSWPSADDFAQDNLTLTTALTGNGGERVAFATKIS